MSSDAKWHAAVSFSHRFEGQEGSKKSVMCVKKIALQKLLRNLYPYKSAAHFLRILTISCSECSYCYSYFFIMYRRFQLKKILMLYSNLFICNDFYIKIALNKNKVRVMLLH